MTSVLSAIFVLGVLIFFHELGHFLVAKRAGIRVEKFSLGFPPTIFKKKYGETEYCIGVVPLGGYVKMAGETPGEEITGAPDEFMSKSVSARALVIFAGPLANFIIAFLILWGVFWIQGEQVTDPNLAEIGYLADDGPANAAGLQAGDIVTGINGQTVTSFENMATYIMQEVEKEITVSWLRDNLEMSATMTTMLAERPKEDGTKDSIGVIGVGPLTHTVNYGFFEAAGKGWDRTVEFGGMVFDFLYKFLTGKVSAKMIGGPVFILQMAGQTAEHGFGTLLAFMALLSVNLGILNVLPIPILDGGHLLFLLIEKIKGSPISMNARIIAQQVGLVVLLITIVMVTYNDIARWFTN